MSSRGYGKKKRDVGVRRFSFVFILCLVMLLPGCGFSDGGDQITKIDEKYLAQQDSPAPGKQETPAGDISETESPGEKDSGKTQEETQREDNGKDTSGEKNTENSVEKKQNPVEKNTSEKSSDNSANSKTSRNTKDSKTSRKKPSPTNSSSPAPGGENSQDSSRKEDTKGDSNSVTCYISIDCKTILSNMSHLKENKKEYVPGDGMILNKTKVAVEAGTSVYDVLYQICREKKIHLEAAYTPMYKTYYVEGIHQLYEFDCGDLSGWNYTVNGVQPSYGCSKYQVKEGDVIALRYTCNGGKDL